MSDCMRIAYIVLKVLIVISFFEIFLTLKLDFFYILNALLILASIYVIIGLNGRREVRALLFITVLRSITETYIAYDLYESIFTSMLSVLIGIIIIGFLYSYQYEVD